MLDVSTELFKRMKQNAILKQVLIYYFEQNQENLAFQLVN